MSIASTKIVFAGPGADTDLYYAAIADFGRNRERNSEGEEVEKTAFHPGDPYYFLVQHDPGLRIRAVRSSWGSVQATGATTRTHSEDIQLAEPEDELETDHIPLGGVSARWYGNSPAIGNTGRAVRYRSGPLPAIGTMQYSAAWHGYRLVPAALSLRQGEEWPVLIVVYLDTASV